MNKEEIIRHLEAERDRITEAIDLLAVTRDLTLLRMTALLRVSERKQAKVIGNFNSATRLNYWDSRKGM